MKGPISGSRLALLLALTALSMAPAAPTQGETKGAAPRQPYVQITSVTIEPRSIHLSKEPDETTITVLMIIRGDPSPGATAQVEVGTYSTDPPGIRLRYPPSQSQIVKLQRANALVVLRFKAKPEPASAPGKVQIAASYGPATHGVQVEDPVCPKAYIGELTLLR